MTAVLLPAPLGIDPARVSFGRDHPGSPAAPNADRVPVVIRRGIEVATLGARANVAQPTAIDAAESGPWDRSATEDVATFSLPLLLELAPASKAHVLRIDDVAVLVLENVEAGEAAEGWMGKVNADVERQDAGLPLDEVLDGAKWAADETVAPVEIELRRPVRRDVHV
jgi:hypothetical protein